MRPIVPIETVNRLCTPNAVVTSDSLVEQVAQIEDLARGQVDGREFFRRNHFTDGLQRLVERGFERLAGRTDDGAFYLTQAMGGGKTHSLIAFGLLAADPALRREVVPRIRAGAAFGVAKVVIFNGHQNPENLLWGFIGEQLGHAETMAPFWSAGARTPGVDEWVAVLGDEPVLILLDELPSYLQMAQGEPVGNSTLGTLKTELVHQGEYPDRDAARRDLFAYIEGYYNRQRRHSAIGYITPEQAEAKSA